MALSFLEWLASVTERVHQAMHYQFDGESFLPVPPASPGLSQDQREASPPFELPPLPPQGAEGKLELWCQVSGL